MAKAKKSKTEKTPVKQDNTQKLALYADISISNLFLYMDEVSAEDLLTYSADVCLQAANRLKDRYVGETDKEKIENVVKHIFSMLDFTLNPKPLPTEGEAPAEPAPAE